MPRGGSKKPLVGDSGPESDSDDDLVPLGMTPLCHSKLSAPSHGRYSSLSTSDVGVFLSDTSTSTNSAGNTGSQQRSCRSNSLPSYPSSDASTLWGAYGRRRTNSHVDSVATEDLSSLSPVKDKTVVIAQTAIDTGFLHALEQLNFVSTLEPVDLGSQQHHIEHYIAKHGTELTYFLAMLSALVLAIDPTLISASGQFIGGLGLMYSEVIINALEAKRLWEYEDHNVTANNIKIAINAFNAVQIAFFAYNPLVAFAAAPASFTLGVLCETVLTRIEMAHARSQIDFSRWFDDQIIALDYFADKIDRVQQKLEQIDLSEAQRTFNNAELIRLSHKRNAVYFDIEARRRAYLTKSLDEPTTIAAVESKESILARKLALFPVGYTMSTTGFAEWLDAKTRELNNADNFLMALANKKFSRILRLADTELAPVAMAIDTLSIKVSLFNSAQIIVYWSEDNCIVEKTLDKPDFFDTLPAPGERSTAGDLGAKLFLLSNSVDQLVTRRNHLLLDIERRCDSYEMIPGAAIVPKTIISNSFQIKFNYQEKKFKACSLALDFHKNPALLASGKNTCNARDKERDRLIQATADAFYQLQVERFRIKMLTCLGMTTLVLGAAGVSAVCPALAPAMAFIAIAGCYYMLKANQKACLALDKQQASIPPALRSEEPLRNFSSYLPRVPVLDQLPRPVEDLFTQP